jgi:3-hydroxybutyryl-CoA dehydrogenase
MKRPVETVLVVGYGAMGSGIALSFARAGFDTCVLRRDPSQTAILRNGIRAIGELPEAPPDLVIESIPEDLGLKRALFERLARAYANGPILATNTSGLAIEDIAPPAARERFLAVHYMHPADALPMVEVACLPETRADVLARCRAALERSGKEVIVLKRPVIGFLINRLQHALLHEAYHLIETGVVDVEDVDRFARRLFGPRMCVTGLIEQKDLSGLEVHALAQRSIVPALHHSPEPCRVLQDKVEAGDLGAKTGKGFYDWRGRDVAAYRHEAKDKMARLVAFLDAL